MCQTITKSIKPRQWNPESPFLAAKTDWKFTEGFFPSCTAFIGNHSIFCASRYHHSMASWRESLTKAASACIKQKTLFKYLNRRAKIFYLTSKTSQQSAKIENIYNIVIVYIACWNACLRPCSAIVREE
jgi:hypothetical protein